MDPQSANSGPSLKATRLRRCLHCFSAIVTPTLQLTATIDGIQVEYQCHDCSKGFVLLR
jgi:hypothetical protein